MKKLKLNLDEIKVESFETIVKNENQKGTVIAYATEATCTCSPECIVATWGSCEEISACCSPSHTGNC